MKKHTLYHGTNNHIDQFSNDYLSTKEAYDQYGSGFYFYDTIAKTSLHGSICVVAEIEINKVINYNDTLKLTPNQIYTLVCASPSLDRVIEDNYDVKFEGFNNCIDQYCSIFSNQHFLDTLNVIGDDLFEPKDTHILLDTFIKETGIDCIQDTDRGIFILLTNQNIVITDHLDLFTK